MSSTAIYAGGADLSQIETLAVAFSTLCPCQDYIEKTTLNGSELSLKVNGNIISISGLPASKAVRVYALDGSCILETISDSEGHANLSTGRMSQGTYLIKAGSCSAKLAIK